MPGELARLALWWGDAFIAYRRIVCLAGGIDTERVSEVSQVARWEWVDAEDRERIATGMRAVMAIAHDWSDR